jgi:phosphonate transport system permease protein
MAAIVFIMPVSIRLLINFSGEDSSIAKIIPDMEWYQTVKIIGEEKVGVSGWEWPVVKILNSEIIKLELGLEVVFDIIAGVALAVIVSVLYGLSAMKEAPRRRYIVRGVGTAVFAAVLVYTYHWCNIDPLGVWQSRDNAWRHLAGRTFKEDEIKRIREDAGRAPFYYAEGEANYIVGKKYKNVPPEDTPSIFEKQKEVKKIKKQILGKMTPEKKNEIIENEYARLLDKKKGGYWPPELSPKRIWVYTTALMETIAIAIWASIMAVICAIPLSILAADNTLNLIAPGDNRFHRAIRWAAVFLVRRFMDSCRGFNELVMALIFVSVIGLGPFAGILALWVHTTGILGKVFSEAIEAIDPGQVEAIVGTGAGSVQTISFSVMPQVMPTVISYSLLRFESNVRSAAILGWVGAGGIGFLLQDKMVGYSHREVCTMMIMIIFAVSLIDYFCGKLRRRFI